MMILKKKTEKGDNKETNEMKRKMNLLNQKI